MWPQDSLWSPGVFFRVGKRRRASAWCPLGKETDALPAWLNPGDNSWQMTAATLVGLMSVPGLVVLYGGVMQKRWSVNSMMLAFIAFALVLVMWVLYGFKMGFGSPMHSIGGDKALLRQLPRQARAGARTQSWRTGERSRTSVLPACSTSRSRRSSTSSSSSPASRRS